MDNRPFEGIKVLDFTWGGVGPFVGNFLAYYGAMTVRIESASRPDVTRQSQGPSGSKVFPGLEKGPTFALTHPVKKYGISLNLNNPKAVEIFKKLAVWADILVESFTAGTMEKYGMGYEDLKKINPRIIMMRTCGYGHTGAMASQPGFGQTITSLTGFYTIAGWPDRPPVPISSFYTDHLSPLFGGLALIAALDYQRRTGQGQEIDQAQVETGINYLAPVILDYTVNGRKLTLKGNHSDIAAPHGVYHCRGKDRWVAIGAFTDEEWNSFCRVIGNPAWTEEERFKTLSNRVTNAADLDRLVNAWTVNFTAEQVMAMMQGAGVASGVVATAQDSEEDPQLKEYDFFHQIDHPYLGNYSFYHTPGFTLSEATAERSRPTYLGEYTEYICTQILGIPDHDFVQLKQEGVFD